MPAGEKPPIRRYFMSEKGMVVTVTCERCGIKMAKWKRSAEDEAEHPFPFDSICGKCICPKEVARVYPNTNGKVLK